MSAGGRVDDLPPLRMRLMHCRGRAAEGLLVFPPEGAGLADALRLGGGHGSDPQWRAANLCRIGWQGSWQLHNGSSALVCALNGERVWPHEQVAVAVGDAVEVGLLRFVVEGDGAEAESLVEGNFQLRDLADLVPSQRDSGMSAVDGLFGVPGVAGAEDRPVDDVFAELLGEPSSHPAAPPEPSRSPASATGADARGTDADARDAPRLAPPANLPTGESALFDALNREFEHVVRDPTQLTGRLDWDTGPAPGGERAPSLEELSDEAGKYHLLRDILQAREGIDQIIDGVDPLGPSLLLEEGAAEDVLRLFAPGLARAAKPVLPSLTRREHHDLSPDSHVRIGASHAGREAAPPPDPGERHAP